jgi:hypothetical protein
MKKFAIAAALSIALAGTAAQAQTLQPQMSAQDVANGMQVERSHIIVPIFAMLLLLAAAGGGNNINMQ